jgi:hypothetical protein
MWVRKASDLLLLDFSLMPNAAAAHSTGRLSFLSAQESMVWCSTLANGHILYICCSVLQDVPCKGNGNVSASWILIGGHC